MLRLEARGVRQLLYTSGTEFCVHAEQPQISSIEEAMAILAASKSSKHGKKNKKDKKHKKSKKEKKDKHSKHKHKS